MLMERCSLCNGRIIQAEEGVRCMNSACANATVKSKDDGYFCQSCGTAMSFKRYNPYGDPVYYCTPCHREVNI